MQYARKTANVNDYATNSYAVTPNDGADIGDFYPLFVHFSGGGTVSFQLAGDTADRSMTVAAGDRIYAAFRRINSTGTTATGIVAFY